MAKKVGRVVRWREGWRIDLRAFGAGYLYRTRNERFTSKRHAQSVLDGLRARLGKESLEVLVDEYRGPRRSEHLVPRWATRFLADYRARVERYELSPQYVAELERWAQPGGHWRHLAHLSVFEVEGSHVRELERALSQDLHPNTVTKVLGGFHRLLAFVRENTPKRMGFVMPEFPRRRHVRHTPRVVTLEVQDAILAAIPEDRRGVFLAMRLGVRPGEARAFDVADYDFGSGLLTVAHAMQGQSHEARRAGTKESTVGVIEVDADLRGWIEAHVRPRERLESRPLFRHPKARRRKGYTDRWTTSSLSYEWRKACVAVGVVGVSMYPGTKHSSATAARRAGIPLDVIQRALRHRDARSTELYAELEPVTPAAIFRPKR